MSPPFEPPAPGAASAVHSTGDTLTLRLTGSLTGSTVAMVRLHLITLAGAWRPRELVLDLSGVEAIDVAGVGPLLDARRMQVRQGGLFRVGDVSARALEFLRAEPGFAELLTASPESPPVEPHVEPDVEPDVEQGTAHAIGGFATGDRA